MTSAEYRRVIAALGLSQDEAAELLGVHSRTSRKWANDERKVPPPASKLLRLLHRLEYYGKEEIRKVLHH